MYPSALSAHLSCIHGRLSVLGGDEADIEPATFGFEYPGGDFRSRLAKHPYASSCHFGIGVDHPYGHTPETFLPEQRTARGVLP